MNGPNNATKSYNLFYNFMGGESGPSATPVLGNDYYAIAHISSETPIRKGFVFSGWSFSPDGPAEVFSEDLLTLTSDTTLYAVWAKENSDVPVSGNETEENAKPLGVVASSKDNFSMDAGVVLGCSLLVVALFLVIFTAARHRQPQILSKEYDNSDDPEL